MAHTEEEKSIALLHVANLFYDNFSQLVAQHLAMVPPDMQGDLLYRLQENASVFGSKYEFYLKAAAPAAPDAVEQLLQQFEQANKSI